MEHIFQFTIFTPTYNRAHTLPRVYESLLAQTFRDFEWLIVDDGSSDDTRELIGTWRQDGKISIQYHYQENQGKHFAHNLALQHARGNLFTVLDSDDECLPGALDLFASQWDEIQKRMIHRLQESVDYASIRMEKSSEIHFLSMDWIQTHWS